MREARQKQTREEIITRARPRARAAGVCAYTHARASLHAQACTCVRSARAHARAHKRARSRRAVGIGLHASAGVRAQPARCGEAPCFSGVLYAAVVSHLLSGFECAVFECVLS